MAAVVADTSPLNYLALIGEIEVLPGIFDIVTVPDAVLAELRHPASPTLVRNLFAATPAWIRVLHTQPSFDPGLSRLHTGEIAAIDLAITIKADLLLMDDRAGVATARSKGLTVTGTLGVLDLAARRKMVALAGALTRLKSTSFRYPPRLLADLLAQHER